MKQICSFLILSVGLIWHQTNAIGEGVLDINSLGSIFRGFGDIFSNVNTTEVDTRGLMGRWHQMYKAAINFDVFKTQMYCPVSYFKTNIIMGPHGFTMQDAFHVISKNGPIEVYKRDVSPAGPGKFWVYTEQYFYPHQFFIIQVGPVHNGSYQYIIATDQNRLALSVLARDPQDFYQKYDDDVVQFLKDGGFGGDVFWNQPVAIYHGADCFYPTEREVFARLALRDQQSQTGGQNNPLTAGVQGLQNIVGGLSSGGGINQQIPQTIG